MTEAQQSDDKDRFVDRFLGWPLPKSVSSDGCATDPNYPHPRCGTNLLTADEAGQMFEQIVKPLLDAKQAQIDRLMLEYCPEEMSEAQTAEWAKHQRPAPLPECGTLLPDVDWLANVIRTNSGDHLNPIGAGALAEKIVEAMRGTMKGTVLSAKQQMPDEVRELVHALQSYEQADQDGVFVKVSRQACDEAARLIEARYTLSARQERSSDGQFPKGAEFVACRGCTGRERELCRDKDRCREVRAW